MSNILVINGAKQFAHSNGELNDTLTTLATNHLTELGHEVQVTRADSDYNAEAEVEKYLWADVVIYQMPGWWMGAPWTVKNILTMYLRQVMVLFMQTMVVAALMPQKYGSGGLIHDKNICCRLLGMRQWKHLTMRISFPWCGCRWCLFTIS